jgi:hypothetical protein
MTNLSILFVLAAVFVLIPGFVFRSQLLPKYLSNYRYQSSTLFQITLALGTGLLFQFIGLSIVDFFNPFGRIIDWQLIGGIILPDEHISYSTIIGKIGVQSKWITIYNLFLDLSCAIIGFITRLVILTFNLDIRWGLKFGNDWHYTLSGREIRFKSLERFSIFKLKTWLESMDKTKLKHQSFSQHASICVKLDTGFLMVYHGVLVDYDLNDITGQLELLKLQETPTRHIIHLPETQESKEWEYIFPLSVDMLVIPYNQVVNFALTYYELDLIEETVEPI